ncbi:FUSC family protein [Brachybacterium sp. DNPG3]
MTAPIPLPRRVGEALGRRVREGTVRGRLEAMSVARAALASALSYFISGHLLGHPQPFYAAIVGFMIVGFTVEKKMRKMLEICAGVMLGVLIGELARTTIGPGTWQILVVVFVSGMAARLIDKSVVMGFQMAIQSLLVMIMPAAVSIAPGARVLEAMTGLVVGMIVHLLLSGDPRRNQRRAALSFYTELEDTLVSLALAARAGDAEVARAALKGIRDSSQKHTDEWRIANDAADEMASYSPSGLMHADDIQRLRHLLVGSDRAMRNIRVIARTEVDFLVAVGGDPHSSLADALGAARDAVAGIRSGVGHTEVDFTDARRSLRLFCSYLTPELLLRNDNGVRLGRAGHFEGVTLVIQLRSLAMDLLQATGLEASESKRFLPSLLIAGDGDAIGPRPLTQEIRAVEPPATTEALEILIADRSDPSRRR